MLVSLKPSEQSDFASILARLKHGAPSSDPDKRLNAFLRFAKEGEFLRRHQWNLMRLGLEAALGNAPTVTPKSPEQKEARSESSKASRMARRREEVEAAELGITREELSRRKVQRCMSAVAALIDAEANDKMAAILANWVCPDGTSLADCDKPKLEALASDEHETAKIATQHGNFYAALASHLHENSRVASIAAPDFLSAFEAVGRIVSDVGKSVGQKT
jgi:hypothetical protein